MSTVNEFAPGIAIASNPAMVPSTEWVPICEIPLLIFVGLTGVGKSTTVQALQNQGLPFTLLPDRRLLTDELLIGYLQRQDGEAPHPVTDRATRFALTRRYRELFPGGMGHALSQLLVKRSGFQQTTEECNHAPTRTIPSSHGWLFDGLRGANEVRSACQALPLARFVVLAAPDRFRVQRLLGRSDRFDQIAVASHHDETRDNTNEKKCFAKLGVPEADILFTAEEAVQLLALCEPPLGNGSVSVDDLRAKLKIVVAERNNYDPAATVATLQAEAPKRTLVIDTTQVRAVQAAQQIVGWLMSTEQNSE